MNKKIFPSFPPRGSLKFTQEEMDEVEKQMKKLFSCRKCGTTMKNSIDNYCYSCEKIIQEEKKQEYLNELKKLTIEERLSKIELWIFEHSKNHPVKEFIMR